MSETPDDKPIMVSSADELVGQLFRLAVQYRDTFHGVAVLFDGGGEVQVEVNVDGSPKTFQFVSKNPISMISFIRTMEGRGYLHEALILHEEIIRQVNESLEKERIRRESSQPKAKASSESPAATRQRILEAIMEIQGDGPGYVGDAKIAERIGLDVNTVKGHLDILASERRIQITKTISGRGAYSAYLLPGQRQAAKEAAIQPETVMPTTADPRKVFVVYGRNETARAAIYTFLRAIGLEPLEWSQMVAATGSASPYVGEVLETGFSLAQAVVVVLTPDDEARLRQPYVKADDPPDEKELTPQPRPNVLLEAGMALGQHRQRTIILQFGKLRQVSDLLGRHVIRMTDAATVRNELAQRLATAGCVVNTTGSDWLTAGDFTAVLREVEATSQSVSYSPHGQPAPGDLRGRPASSQSHLPDAHPRYRAIAKIRQELSLGWDSLTDDREKTGVIRKTKYSLNKELALLDPLNQKDACNIGREVVGSLTSAENVTMPFDRPASMADAGRPRSLSDVGNDCITKAIAQLDALLALMQPA